MTDQEYDSYDLRRPRVKRKGLSDEWRLQCACVKALRQRMRLDKSLRFIANMPEGQRDAKRAGLAKMMGLAPGVADMIVLHKTRAVFRMDWVEFKRDDGKLSPAQADWAAWLATTPIKCHVVRTIDDFIKVIDGL